jgi:DNA-directed RNA polymerase II subunit RPB1
MKRLQTNEYTNPSKIIGIQFSMLSPEEIRKNSVVEVVSRDANGGLFDVKMGVLEKGMFCPTDGLTYMDTPGYFGHMELAMPVLLVQHLKDIMKVCKVICYKCSKLMINKTKYAHLLKMSPEERWPIISNHKVTRCGQETEDGCGCKQPKYKVDGFAAITAIWDRIKVPDTDQITSFQQKLDADKIYKMFKRISDEDVQFMGFSPLWSRPEWMICSVLPVPPPAVRPSVKHDAQQRSEDDLTHIYMNILKYNNIIKDAIANQDNVSNQNQVSTKKLIEKNYLLLQYYVTMLSNNKASGTSPLGQNSGRTFQCISSRLNTKNGRVRGNLMGKRVDFSARSVITGDPNLSITQLGVPMKIAKNITRPMLVNERNRNYLTKLIQNGPDIYPGANRLERRNGDQVSLRYVDRESLVLEIGDKVHRHMMDGDYVLFNRQPSLHKMSMMCHEVKVMKKGDTFRFNVGVTNPYNADFDGDEMNMHMPQSTTAETELMYLPAVTQQLVSPSKNSPIIGIFQDSLLGCFRFTRNTVKLHPLDVMNYLMMTNKIDLSLLDNKKANYSSFDVLSHIFPPLTMKTKTKNFSDPEKDKNQVIHIQNGRYLGGQMEKSIMASASKGILHRIINNFSNETCVQFIDDLQNIITEYMKTSSFSVGISDLIANNTTKQEILHTVHKQKQDVQSLIQELHLGIYENNSAYSNAMDFETRVNNILNKATEQAGKIGRNSLSKSNRFLMIVNSGSKGSPINISQMLSCLGQQSVEGKRVPYGFEHRTLPHFSKYDDSPGARGFIENSFIGGLTPYEMFFHAMAGRIGLIDTAVKTSETGYIQRRIIKSLEDIYIAYDQTVRNHMGKIVQFAYGDDNFDSTKVENQNIALVEMSIEDIYMHYDVIGLQDTDTNKSEIIEVFTKDTAKRLQKQKNETKTKLRSIIESMIEAREKLVRQVFAYKNENVIRLPVHFAQIIKSIQGQLELDETFAVNITPLEAIDMIEANYKRMMSYNQYSPENQLFKILYDFHLSPKTLLVKYRFHKQAMEMLLDTIFLKYKQAIVHPGEMVGVIAAQSVGEPTTQLTLNTFHNVGVASKSNVTRGVPRIEEILRLTKNPKNPSLTITLKSQDAVNKEKAMKYANMIEHTRLYDIVKSVRIYYDPSDDDTVIEEDKAMMEHYFEYENLIKEMTNTQIEDDEKNKSKWIIRLEMNADTMLDKNIRMDDVYFAIHNLYGNKIHCKYSDYNDQNLIFRIRMNTVINKKDTSAQLDSADQIYMLKSFQDTLLKKTILRGVDHISKVLPRKVPNNVIKEDGKYVRKDTWVLDTTGTNFLEVLGLSFIDTKHTYSNDIYEVYKTLGIEAARQCILTEFMEVMEHSDVYLNYHHLSVLCDRMTYNGKDMVAVYRSGFLKDNIGPIAKATFEMHTEMFLNAARHGHLDNMRGVSANVMCGQYGYFGTGAFNVILDLEAMEKNNEDADSVQFYNGNHVFDKASTGISKQEFCSKDNILVNNHITEQPELQSSEICDDDYEMGF